LGLLDGFCCGRLDLHGFEQHLSLLKQPQNFCPAPSVLPWARSSAACFALAFGGCEDVVSVYSKIILKLA
jgi:hypothetical protein